MYANGDGVVKDVKEAAKYYKKGCELDDGISCTNLGPSYRLLGEMYANGDGVVKDVKEAAKYYKKACEIDESTSCTNLGEMYANGDGVVKDVKEAVEHYTKACTLDEDRGRGCTNLGEIYANGYATDDSVPVYGLPSTCKGRGCSGGQLKLNDVVQVDLNGDGTEETLIIRTTKESVSLFVGDSRVTIPHDKIEYSAYSLELINIDERDASKQIYAQTCDEYWGSSSIIVVFDGKRLKSIEHLSDEDWGLGCGVSFPGQGRIVEKVVRCDGNYYEPPDRPPKLQTTTIYRLSNTKSTVRFVTEVSRTAKEIGLCSFGHAAACPYVYVDGKFKGEILRYLKHPNLEKTQSLELGRRFQSTSITVTISEEKPEVTHLNAIWIVQNGEKILPSQCSNDGPAYCALDRNYYLLEKGDSIELSFELLDANSPVELWGHGYYLPTYKKH
jgi:tetratricopeptide (TPR) repeat protein